MKRTLAAIALALIVVTSASAVESTIYPGVGIGKVKLGMTLGQVKKILGPPQTVNRRAQVSGKRGYIEYGWDFSTLWVGFVNTKGVLHAVLVGTDFRNLGQIGGIGIGTVREKLKSKLPVVPCAPTNYQTGAGSYYRVSEAKRLDYCLFGPASGRVTVFDIYTDPGKDCQPQWTYEHCTWYVKQILVTGRF